MKNFYTYQKSCLKYIVMLIINCILLVQAFANCIHNSVSTQEMIILCSPLYISMIILFLLSNYNINKLEIQ